MISYKDGKIEYEEIERNVEVTLHSWKLFKEIYKSADLSTKIYQRSFSPVLNCDQVFKSGEGAGRSGSFFFYSHDSRFIVKTMSKGELKLFQKILPQYA
jgi:hypothetical protein